MKFSGPHACALCFPVERERSVCASIVGLLVSGCPPAVIGTVVAINVNPVDLHAYFPRRKHVFGKVRERVPPFAYRYASTSVAVVVVARFVVAPLKHTSPLHINRMWLFALSAKPVSHLPLSVLASAGLPSGRRCERLLALDRGVAAVTLADPLSVHPSDMGLHVDHCQKSEPRPAKILAFEAKVRK